MSKELTAQWKNGELKEGWYYIKYEDNYIGIAFACVKAISRCRKLQTFKLQKAVIGI